MRRNVKRVGSVGYPLREVSPWLAVDGLVPSINVGREGRRAQRHGQWCDRFQGSRLLVGLSDREDDSLFVLLGSSCLSSGGGGGLESWKSISRGTAPRQIHPGKCTQSGFPAPEPPGVSDALICGLCHASLARFTNLSMEEGRWLRNRRRYCIGLSNTEWPNGSRNKRIR
jgi:hypothetical protein